VRISYRFAPFVVAGVAELADALDSKSIAMLGKHFAVAVSLPMATKPRPASQDRARIVFDCRMTDDPAMMSSTNPAHVQL
jgi:hypothetical protein